MDLLYLVVVIAVLGLVWYLVVNFIPLPPQAQVVVNVVFVLILVVVLLQAFGLTHLRLERGG
jgi:hypothetical protein